MKPSLLEYLACPACHGALALEIRDRRDGEVMEGALSCPACAASWPIRGGVPRFTGAGGSAAQRRTADAFGWEWQAFPRLEDHHTQQFLDWIAPATPASFAGKVVLEGGCGKGRHTRLVARWGAKAIIGVDLSEAADVAWRNTRQEANAHVVQADLLSLPLRPGSVDHAFSVGVIHHLEEPAAGFAALTRAVRPGGAISVWVYGEENNAWITRLVTPLRVAIGSRLPARALYGLSFVLALPLWLALRLVYRPATRPGLAWLRPALFYYPYLSYISAFPFREVHHIVHDHLAAPVAHYLRREQVEDWYRRAGARQVVIAWHNRNSWRGYGVIGAGDGGGAR